MPTIIWGSLLNLVFTIVIIILGCSSWRNLGNLWMTFWRSWRILWVPSLTSLLFCVSSSSSLLSWVRTFLFTFTLHAFRHFYIFVAIFLCVIFRAIFLPLKLVLFACSCQHKEHGKEFHVALQEKHPSDNLFLIIVNNYRNQVHFLVKCWILVY